VSDNLQRKKTEPRSERMVSTCPHVAHRPGPTSGTTPQFDMATEGPARGCSNLGSDPISPQSPPAADLAQDRRRHMSTRPSPRKRPRRSGPSRSPLSAVVVGVVLLVAVTTTFAVLVLRSQYTFSLQSPVRVHLQWPLVVAAKTAGEDALEAQTDQFGRRLTAYQQYACNKFGSACRVALAIQRAENPRGACEIYHYNSDGTLDWGYFQVNTVHLTRIGLNLRDLLDCRANIDFAYQLYQERGFQPWSTYNNGAYRKFLRNP
jgi:hypothetical protein